MGSFKGTPGPWEIGNHNSCVISKNDESLCIKGAVGEDAIKYYGGNLICESISQANAKLIAAAPELLEALEYYFDVLEEARGKDWAVNPDHVLSKMLNAVKKATE